MPNELKFNDLVDVEPDPTGCSGLIDAALCNPREEARWNLGTLAASEVRTITIDALVDVTVLSGNLIAVPVRVTATGMLDVIDLLDVIAVQN